MELLQFLLILLFFATAVLYSSAGLGGGSTYLALLVLFGFSHTEIPIFALSCNLLVVSSGAWNFGKAGYFRSKNVLPFLMSSIPFAYWGARFNLSKELFSFLLALSLAFAALHLLWRDSEKQIQTPSWPKVFAFALPLGALTGFLSGLIGIGGGIFLSPLLLFLGWANSKQAAAAASVFILLNSLSGLMGQVSKLSSWEHSSLLFPLLLAVFCGSQIGSRFGAFEFSKLTLQRISAAILLWTGVRILVGVL